MIDLGQLGDVVLSLPALSAVRERFADARMTVLVGKPAVGLIEMSHLADEVISIDRRELRNSPKLQSIANLFRLTRDIRSRRFDLVIDLHSFYETNILGFLSGAPQRLYANRENRSLDFLAKFPTRPPLEDKSLHHADRYLNVIRPLGIENAERMVRLFPDERDKADINSLLAKNGVNNKTLVGIFLGAGHPTRRWSLDKFAELADRLAQRDDVRVLAFLGPEERGMRAEAKEKLSDKAIVVHELGITSFFAAIAVLDVLVCGDTGPMHLGALAGTPIVLLSEKLAPTIFLPLTDKLRVLTQDTVDEIEVGDVYASVMELTDDHSDKHKQPKQDEQQ
jgi:ADP-heptose:LPS heptosyltransferase